MEKIETPYIYDHLKKKHEVAFPLRRHIPIPVFLTQQIQFTSYSK